MGKSKSKCFQRVILGSFSSYGQMAEVSLSCIFFNAILSLMQLLLAISKEKVPLKMWVGMLSCECLNGVSSRRKAVLWLVVFGHICSDILYWSQKLDSDYVYFCIPFIMHLFGSIQYIADISDFVTCFIQAYSSLRFTFNLRYFGLAA